jgi:glycine/D-amino acid oxidase-like deaminating enzyme
MEDCWPVFPSKGQILAVEDRSHLLQHIVYGEGIYLVPRRQGRLIVGATVEEVGFQPGNTAGAVEQLLREAIALVPAIAEMPWLDLWWGFRPTTPDRAPILGQGPYHQLILATGHDRNGILLAPITAKLIGDQILQGNTDPILSAFSCSRWSPRPSAKD